MSRAGHPRGFCPHGIDIDSACVDCLKVTRQSSLKAAHISNGRAAVARLWPRRHESWVQRIQLVNWVRWLRANREAA